MIRKGLVSAAVTAVLAMGSFALADNSSATASPSPSNAQLSSNAIISPVYGDDTTAAPAPPAPAAAPAAAEAAPAPRAPLMWAFDQIGLAKPMDDLHLNIYGYVEAGYMYDFTVPRRTTPDRSAPGDFILFPGTYKDSVMLNQLDLSIERTVDASKGQFDVGFKVEGIFGRDAVYIHSNGILDSGNKQGKTSPDDDLDLNQAYLTFAIPLGSGLTVTAGKFVTLLGNETINPTGNSLYTHSYIFSYGIPFTQTGVLGAYNLSDSWKLIAGITRGWNQTLYDNNGAIDFLGELVWTVNSKLGVTLNLSEGPQSTRDNEDYWTVIEPIVSLTVSDQLKLTGDFLYGDASSIAQWYAAAGYATYTMDKYAALNLRAELYHDGRGFTTGVAGTDINYFEATAGVGFTPLPDNSFANTLTIRPELRFDSANHAVLDGRKFTQLTAAVDAYWKF